MSLWTKSVILKFVNSNECFTFLWFCFNCCTSGFKENTNFIFFFFFFSNYSLCEITVEDEGLIKQRRLPDMLPNLPDRIHLNGRSVNRQLDCGTNPRAHAFRDTRVCSRASRSQGQDSFLKFLPYIHNRLERFYTKKIKTDRNTKGNLN